MKAVNSLGNAGDREMKKFRFWTEVFVEADSLEEAEEIFSHIGCYDWEKEEVEESDNSSPAWFIVSSRTLFEEPVGSMPSRRKREY